MLFNSSTFLIFVLLTFFIYYNPKLRTIQVPILVIASFIFYAWSSPALLILLVISILINAVTSFKVANASYREKLVWALTGVAVNLLILSLFKYGALLTNLFVDTFQASNKPEAGIVYLLLHLPLPVGISFYTFEGISLLVDVLRQPAKGAENASSTQTSYVDENLTKHIINTSFFVAFFPHLIAGPILKAKSFYPQIGVKYFRSIPWNFVFRTLVVGYFLKMVIADNLKDYTYWITYPYYQGLGTVTNLVLLFGYSMQIFADFAGYSLIAIGVAAAFGYQLPDNFNFPYISCSIAEFWRRWHISLSTWLRDYLYFPLGGNRKGKVRTYINLMIVMTLGGLWHGAAWSYAVWGIFHGVGLAIERFFGLEKSNEQTSTSIPIWKQFFFDLIKVIFVFCFVSLGWLLFKLPNFGEAIDFLATLVRNVKVAPGLTYIVPVLIFSFPVVVYHIPHFPTFRNRQTENLLKPKSLLWSVGKDIAIGIMLVLLFLNSGSSQEFIYFQF